MKVLVGIIALLTAASAFAVFGTLVGQSIKGSLKYCEYSNGVILTIASYQICPVSNG